MPKAANGVANDTSLYTQHCETTYRKIARATTAVAYRDAMSGA